VFCTVELLRGAETGAVVGAVAVAGAVAVITRWLSLVDE